MTAYLVSNNFCAAKIPLQWKVEDIGQNEIAPSSTLNGEDPVVVAFKIRRSSFEAWITFQDVINAYFVLVQ